MIALLPLMLLFQTAPSVPPALPGTMYGGDEQTESAADEDIRDPVTGELPVEPYRQGNTNAGAEPFRGAAMARAFHGREGVRRVADGMVDGVISDPRIADIFRGTDLARLRRTLFEQFCYILNAGCDYSGRDMAEVHKNIGTQRGDMNALVENLQEAMRTEGVSFAAQNRFLSKLAPMEKDVVVR